MSLLSLPQELISQIFSFLEVEDLCTIDLVNQDFHKLADNCWKNYFTTHFMIDSSTSESASRIILANDFEEWKENLIKTISDLCEKVETHRQHNTLPSKAISILDKSSKEPLVCLKKIDPTKSWKSLFAFVLEAFKYVTNFGLKQTMTTWDQMVPLLQYPPSTEFNYSNPKCMRHVGSLLHWLLNLGTISPTFIGQLQKLKPAFAIPMDFEGVDIFNAFWFFCSRMQLPGEASLIDSWVEQIARVYKACNPSCRWDEDSIYLLCFSLVMLHTDAHNARIKKKMSLDEFQRSMRGTQFKDEDLVPWYELTQNFWFTGQRWSRRKMTCKYSGIMHLCISPQKRKLQFKTRQVKCYCKVENQTFTWKCLEELDINDNSSELQNGDMRLSETTKVEKLITSKYAMKIENKESYPYIKIEHQGIELKFFAETEENAEVWKSCIQGCCLGFEALEAKVNANVENVFAANQWLLSNK